MGTMTPVPWVGDLIRIFQRIEKGEFDFQLPESLSSLGPSVSGSFEQMLRSLTERQREIESDVSSAREAIQELLASYEELTALQLLSSSLNTTFDLDEVLNLFINLAGEILEYQGCALLMPDGKSFSLRLSRNISPELSEIPERDISLNLLHWCLKENKVVPLSYEDFVGKPSDDSHSFVLVPTISHERAIGVMILECLLPSSQVTQQQSIMLGLLSAQTAVACENAELYRGLKEKNVELAQLKNYLSNILENVTTGIIALDTEGHITSFNRAAERIFHLKSTDVSGKLFYEVFEEPLRSKFRELFLSSMVAVEVSNYELDSDLSGSSIPLQLSTSLLRDESGNPIGFVLACRDISETKELDAIRKVSQLKSEFLSSVSHELRTPLTSIKAYSETILTRLDRLSRATLIECLQIIDSESDRLARLLDDLLDFSRIDSGRLKLNMQSQNLKPVLDGVVNQMKLQSKSHSLVYDPFPEEMPVTVDSDRVKQALINLMSNAIKYSPDGGEVYCKVSERDGLYYVSVTDHGIGIDAEHLPHIFEKFYRVEGPYMYKISGTGLGLSITKAIIEAHGGSIWAESEIGKGTTMHFTLPKNQ